MFFNKFNELVVIAILICSFSPLKANDEEGGLSPRTLRERTKCIMELLVGCSPQQIEFIQSQLASKRSFSGATPEPKRPCPEVITQDIEFLTAKLEGCSPSKSPAPDNATREPAGSVRRNLFGALPKPETIKVTHTRPQPIELTPGSKSYIPPAEHGVVYGHRKEGGNMQEGSIPRLERISIRDKMLENNEPTLSEKNINKYLLLAEIALLTAIQKDPNVMINNRYVGETTNLQSRISATRKELKDETTRKGIRAQYKAQEDGKRWMHALIEDVPKDYLNHFEVLAGKVLLVFERDATYVSKLGTTNAFKLVNQYWKSKTRKNELVSLGLDTVAQDVLNGHIGQPE